MCSKENTRKIKIPVSAIQLISNMICMNYDHNKKFGLLKFHLGYGKFNLNSPKGYSLKIINVQTDHYIYLIINNITAITIGLCLRFSMFLMFRSILKKHSSALKLGWAGRHNNK